MALSSLSRDQEVWDAYDDNAAFEENDSNAQAKAFITACKILLRRRPTQLSTNGQSISFDDQSIRDELKRARAWQHAKAVGSGVRHLSFRRMRD